MQSDQTAAEISADAVSAASDKTSTETPDGATSQEGSSRQGWLPVRGLYLAALILAPVAALAYAVYVFVATGPPHGVLDGDGALCELAVRGLGVGPWGDGPWVGAYSRLGFHHPGPLHYVLLAPVYWAFESGGGFALALSTCVLHAVLLALAVWVASTVSMAKQNGLVAAAATSFVCVAYVFIHTGECLAAWEPGISRVAILTTAAGAYATAMTRRLPGFLVATFGASLAVQSHLSVVPPIGLVVLIAIAGLLWKGNVWVTCGHPRARALSWATALALLLWIPPMAEQLAGDPGNVTTMLGVLGQLQPTLTGGEIFRLGAMAVTEWSERVFGVTSEGLRIGVCVLQVLAAIAMAGLGVRARNRSWMTLGALAVALHLAVWIAAIRIVGEYSSHLVLFGSTAVWPLVAGLAGFLAGCRRVWVRVLLGVGLTILCGVASRRTAGEALTAVAQPHLLATPGLSLSLPTLANQLRERGADRVVVQLPGDHGDGLRLVAGVVLGLRKSGFEVVPDQGYAWAFPFESEVMTAATRVELVPHAEDTLPVTAAFGARIVSP